MSYPKVTQKDLLLPEVKTAGASRCQKELSVLRQVSNLPYGGLIGLLRQDTRGSKTKRHPGEKTQKQRTITTSTVRKEHFVAALADQAVLLRSTVWVGGGPVRALLTKLSGTVPIGLPA